MNKAQKPKNVYALSAFMSLWCRQLAGRSYSIFRGGTQTGCWQLQHRMKKEPSVPVCGPFHTCTFTRATHAKEAAPTSDENATICVIRCPSAAIFRGVHHAQLVQ